MHVCVCAFDIKERDRQSGEREERDERETWMNMKKGQEQGRRGREKEGDKEGDRRRGREKDRQGEMERRRESNGRGERVSSSRTHQYY